MSLERDPAHLGKIGIEQSDREPDPDRIYEREIERRWEREE